MRCRPDEVQSCVVAAAFAATTFFLVAPAHAEGDPEEGAKAFRRCAVCHTVEEGGSNKIGPNLWGVVGSVSGTRETGFCFASRDD